MLQTTARPAQPPPSLASPGGQGGPGTIGRAAWGRRTPSIASHGAGLLARARWPRGCGQPPRSPDRPSKGFFPPNFLCPGPQPRAQSCSPGLCRGTAPRAGARGRFPPPLTWGRGAALATFPRGCSNPQYFGTEASGLQAVYQEYPRVAMATWASPWEPEGRQSCKHPAGHKQALSSPCPPPLQPMGFHHRVRCGGTPRPAAPRGPCSPPQSTPAPRLASPHAPQGKDLSPRMLRAC